MRIIESLVLAWTFFAGAAHAGPDWQPPPSRLGPIAPVAPVVSDPGDGRAVLVPATVEYEWVFHVPVVSIKPQRFVVTVPEASTRWKRWDYDVPAFRSRRIKLWDAPEFSCKYPDQILPNECKTVWHGVYVDVPVLVSEREHLDVDVPQIRMTEQSFRVDVARWTWAEKRFRFSLPALAPAESVERLRISLNAQRSAIVAASDEAIAAIDRDIDAIEASGGDPASLFSDDGASFDLPAQRRALLDERAHELERLASIDAELSSIFERR